jgi:endonuclease YncB( thermonuclease family)
MNPILRSVLCGGLLWFSATFTLYAQEPGPKPKVALDFSNDPCGNPLVESQVWSSLKGKVAQVIDGRTLLVTLPHNRPPLRVLLVGVGLDGMEQLAAQDKELLSRLLLKKPVEILVNSDWELAVKKPTETSGVVRLVKSTDGVDDVGLFLLSKGLAKFQGPPPYSMSGYTECQYKHAEAQAQSKKLGIWAQPN